MPPLQRWRRCSNRRERAEVAGFSAEWLALREPADHAARSIELTRAVIELLPEGARILDLAAGTGSNLRYLASAGSESRDFLLVDHDPLLLARVQAMAFRDAPEIAVATLDDREIFDGRRLVT